MCTPHLEPFDCISILGVMVPIGPQSTAGPFVLNDLKTEDYYHVFMPLVIFVSAAIATAF